MSSYENVRYSLDNILKELDDICRSIDDLTDIEPSADADTEYYQKIIKNPSIHLSSLGLKKLSGTNKSLEPISSNRTSEIYYTVDDYGGDDDERKQAKTSNVYDRYNLSNFRQSKTFHQTLNTSALNESERSNSNNNTNKATKLKTNILNSLTDRFFNLNKSPFKKHRLPNDDSKGLNTVIGSVRDSFLFKKLNSLPLETKTSEATEDFYKNSNKNYKKLNEELNYTNNNNNSIEENEVNEFDVSRVRDSPKLSKRNTNLISSPNANENNQATYNDSFEYGEEEYLNSNSTTANNYASNRKTPVRNVSEDADYLNPNEIARIECFYNSMGCYVYVGKCIAELYQIKREDEFDAIDSDPVNDYKIYMENLNNKQSLISKAKVNYTYINSGVPVIVFNYGVNPKRDKDLRILLVERSTGFCMWEFKFDWLTQFDLLNKLTIVRLTLNNNILTLNGANNLNGESSSSAAQTAQQTNPTLNYQNEYFEKFFNCKNRHAHKEHLLKFVIKRDCNEFFFVLSRIMNDKRNADMFVVKKESHEITNDESGYFLPPLPISNTSSLIVCHFDSNDPNRLLDSSQSSLADSFTNLDENALKPSLKTNTRKHSPLLLLNDLSKFENIDNLATAFTVEFENDSTNTDDSNLVSSSLNDSDATTNSAGQVKYRKLRKSDISSPLSFNHVSHLDKPVAIGKRYKFNYS